MNYFECISISLSIVLLMQQWRFVEGQAENTISSSNSSATLVTLPATSETPSSTIATEATTSISESTISMQSTSESNAVTYVCYNCNETAAFCQDPFILTGEAISGAMYNCLYCSKTITFRNDLPVVSRGCVTSYSMFSPLSLQPNCISVVGTCTCLGTYCNSAPDKAVLSTATLCLGLALFKFFSY